MSLVALFPRAKTQNKLINKKYNARLIRYKPKQDMMHKITLSNQNVSILTSPKKSSLGRLSSTFSTKLPEAPSSLVI